MPNTITYTSEFVKYFEPLYQSIRDFVFFQQFIRDELKPNPVIVGINASAASIVRKTEILELIESEIKASRAPLQIIDSNPMEKFFKIILKKDV